MGEQSRLSTWPDVNVLNTLPSYFQFILYNPDFSNHDHTIHITFFVKKHFVLVFSNFYDQI
jgi:hypothetical protein